MKSSFLNRILTDLVKFENIEELEQFPVLLRILELDVVLLEPVQSQLGLVVNVYLLLCWSDTYVSRSDLIELTSIGSCMNFLHTGLMSLERVAENIITCFS